MRSRMSTIPALLTTLSLALSMAGCGFISDFIAGPADKRLAEEAVAHWATPGGPFMDGVYGRGAVDAVTETGTWAWEVTVAGDPWALEVTRAEVFHVFAGDEFTAWISDRARQLGFRTFLPPEVLSMVSSGRIAAVGDLEVTFGETHQAGRSTYQRIAYLMVDESGKSTWSIQPEARSPIVLRDALNTVYSDMIVTDDRVMDCMGAVGSGTGKRRRGLGCIGDVLALEFGPGSG